MRCRASRASVGPSAICACHSMKKPRTGSAMDPTISAQASVQQDSFRCPNRCPSGAVRQARGRRAHLGPVDVNPWGVLEEQPGSTLSSTFVATLADSAMRTATRRLQAIHAGIIDGETNKSSLFKSHVKAMERKRKSFRTSMTRLI